MQKTIELQFTDFLDPIFQELILALMVSKKDFLAQARAIVKPKYFSSSVYKHICEALFEYWDEFYEVPNEQSLSIAVSKIPEEQPSTREAYVEATKALFRYSEDDLDHSFLESELVEFCQRAEAAFAIGSAYNDLKFFDIPKLSKDMQRIEMLPSYVTDLGTDVVEEWRDVFQLDTRKAFATGFKTFDRSLRGGMKEGELICFIAPLKRGKSLILLNFGKALFLMGNLVCHYTLEMYKEDVLRRYLASLTQNPVNQIEEYGKDLINKFDSIPNYSGGDVIIKEYPAKTATVAMIDGHMNMIKAVKGRSPIPVIDYADLLVGDSKKEEWKELSEIYVQLRNLGRKHGVPVITASQTNAGGFNAEKIDATHQSGSTRKGFAVDAMLSIEQNDADYALNRFRMVSFLNRNERKDIQSYWKAKYDCSFIEEVNEEEYNAMCDPDEIGDSLLARTRAYKDEKKKKVL